MTAGVVTAPVVVPLTLPPQALLVGIQGSLQAVLVESPVSFAAATAAAFTIR